MIITKMCEAVRIDKDIESQLDLISSIRYASPAHYHDYFEFFLLTSGKCIHRVNNSEQHLSEGALVLIRPDDVHCYDYDGGCDCSFLNICITKAAMESALSYLGDTLHKRQLLTTVLPPYAILSPLEKDNLINRYDKLKALSTINKQKSRLQTRGFIIEILTQYFTDADCSNNKYPSLWLEVLLTQMQKRENFTEGLQRMIEISERSPGHLNRVFKEYLKITPTEYINRVRLSYAKTLIVNTNLKIIDISTEAGYNNLSHFNHLFKKYFGVTPTSLRLMSKKGSSVLQQHNTSQPLNKFFRLRSYKHGVGF